MSQARGNPRSEDADETPPVPTPRVPSLPDDEVPDLAEHEPPTVAEDEVVDSPDPAPPPTDD